MKKYQSNKAKKILLASMAVPLAVSVLPIEQIVEASSDVPTLRIYEIDGSPKLEWATEILKENILIENNFEGGALPQLYSHNGIEGKQSFYNDNGNNVIVLNDTITNKEGNYYHAPQTNGITSLFYFKDRVFIPNGTHLSVSYKIKSANSSKNYVNFNTGDNHGLRGVLMHHNGKEIVYDELVDFTKSAPETIKMKYKDGSSLDDLGNGALFRIITSTKSDYNYGLIFYYWDSEAKVARRSTADFKDISMYTHLNPNAASEIFNTNDSVLVLENIHQDFPVMKIENNQDWELYNANIFLDHNNFDYLKYGFDFSVFWETDGQLMIDDITFGYATEVEVYRDGKSIYKGFLSDFHDTNARDTAKPNKVKNINTSIGNDFNVQFNIEKPQDNGTKVNYKIQSIANNGTRSALSNQQEVELKTDVVKYKYSVSNQETGTPTIETKSLNDLSIALKSINLETDYLHIQAIDKNGNTSEVESFQLKDLINMQELYDKIKQLEDSNNYNDFIDFIDEIEQLYGDNLPQDVKEMIDKLGKHHGVNTSFLLLEEGDFRLSTVDINSFGHTKLTAKKQTLTTAFKGDFGVIDARGTQEGWNVTVSATPFTVETFDGFVGTPHQLPLGSLALNNINHVEQVGTVHNSQLPTITLNQLTAIDGENQTVNLLNASKQKGMGEFKFAFGEDALSLTVDAVTAKIDTVNYPDKNTPYASTVTWNLVSGPQI